MAELRDRYGDDLIPQGKTLKEILNSVPQEIDPHVSRSVFVGVRDSAGAVSPGELQELIRQKLVPALNLMILTNEAKTKIERTGGLGGVNINEVVKNLLTAPGQKAKLNSLSSKADVLKFAGSMKLQQKLADYRTAMQKAVDGLRAIYSADRIPEGIDAAMSMKNKLGQTIAQQVSSKFSGCKTNPLSPRQLQEYIKEELAGPAQHMAVEKALSSKAQAMGFTLSRRAVVLLANDLLQQQVHKTAMDAAADPRALQNAINSMGLDALLQTQKTSVEEQYALYVSQVPEESRALLRSFIEECSFAPSTAGVSKKLVQDMAGRMKEWKNLDGTEEVRQPLNNIFKDAFSSDLEKLEGTLGETTKYTDNIYDSMLGDANRSDFNIDGTVIGKGGKAKQEISTALKKAVPDPKDQQMLSKLMNQRIWHVLIRTEMTGMLPNGTMIGDVPSGNTLLVTPLGKNSMVQDSPGIPSTFTLTVSPDKQTAQVTAVSTYQINSVDGGLIDGKMPDIGGIKITFHFQINLNAHPQGQSVAGFRFGQEFIPLDRLN